MTPQDQNYLQNVLDAFIMASINRTAHSGYMQYRYRLTADEIRQATGRQRFHESFASEVVAFFSMSNVQAEFIRQFGTFDISLDLSVCSLSPTQARDLSVAMDAYRIEHQ